MFDDNLHLMFTDAAMSFFEKSLAVSRGNFAVKLRRLGAGSGFSSLVSLFEDATSRCLRDQMLLLPNAIFCDIRSRYGKDYVSRLDVTYTNRVSILNHICVR